MHEVAEQLEHIQSEKLDKLLEHPCFDLQTIPQKKGKVKVQFKTILAAMAVSGTCKMVAVKGELSSFCIMLSGLVFRLSFLLELSQLNGFFR